MIISDFAGNELETGIAERKNAGGDWVYTVDRNVESVFGLKFIVRVRDRVGNVRENKGKL